jgi:hypothetical protein
VRCEAAHFLGMALQLSVVNAPSIFITEGIYWILITITERRK